MKIHFLKFLLNKAVIDKKTYLQMLIALDRQAPYAAEVVYDQNLLSSVQLSELFDLQFEKECDFFTASKLKGYDSSLREPITSRLETNTIQVLVDSGVISLDALMNLVDEYIAEQKLERAS